MATSLTAEQIQAGIDRGLAKVAALRTIEQMQYETLTAIPETYTKPRTQIVRGDGLWLVEQNKIGRITTHHSKSEVKGLPTDMKEGFELLLPKIPHNFLAQILSFFRKICKDMHEAEAYAVIYYDLQEERYFINVPEHAVSGGAVKYIRDLDLETQRHRYLTAMEIHSHNTMMGRFSSVDTADEKALRLYGVLGNVDKTMPSWEFRAVCSANGKAIPLRASDIFTFSVETEKALKRIPSVVFPTEWTDNVKAIKDAQGALKAHVERSSGHTSYLGMPKRSNRPDRGFDPSMFGRFSDQMSMFEEEEDDDLSALRRMFGHHVVKGWKRHGLDHSDRERIYTYGKDPEEIETALDEGIDTDWLDGDSWEFDEYVDRFCSEASTKQIERIFGRMLIHDTEKELRQAEANLTKDPEFYGKPFIYLVEEEEEEEDGTRENIFS